MVENGHAVLQAAATFRYPRIFLVRSLQVRKGVDGVSGRTAGLEAGRAQRVVSSGACRLHTSHAVLVRLCRSWDGACEAVERDPQY